MRFKKIRCIFGIVLTIMAYILTMPYLVWASNDNSLREVKRKQDSFSEERNNYKKINKKINEELEKTTNQIDSDVEKFLNENGVFDDEIFSMYKKETIDNMKEIGTENLEMYVSYFAVDENIESEEINSKNSIELTTEQVEKYIAEKYYHEDTGIYEELEKQFEKKQEKKISVTDLILESIGLKPIDVYAKVSDYNSGGKDDKNSPTMLKKVMCVSQSKKNGYLWVDITFIWTDIPKHRNLDGVSISWDYATYYSQEGEYSNVYVEHFWTKKLTDYSYAGGKVTKTRESRVFTKVPAGSYLNNGEYSITSTNLKAALDLWHDADKEYPYYINIDYMYDGIEMYFYIKPNYKEVILSPVYSHLIDNCDVISVLISILGDKSMETTYRTLTGKKVDLSTNYSGNRVEWKFICK